MTVRVYRKEIALGDKSAEEIIEELSNADWAGVELNIENRGSFVLVQVETDDDEHAMYHALKADGFSLVEIRYRGGKIRPTAQGRFVVIAPDGSELDEVATEADAKRLIDQWIMQHTPLPELGD